MTKIQFLKKFQIHSRLFLFSAAMLPLCLCLVKFLPFHSTEKGNAHLSLLPAITPWGGVGGCGAGGGSKSGAAIEWMGQGVTGGYVDIEIMPSFTSTPAMPWGSVVESRSVNTPIAIYAHLGGNTLGLTLPFQSINCDYEGTSLNTTGFGDIGVLFTKPLGVENQYSLTLNLTFPTGRFNIYSNGNPSEHIPSSGQLGGGLLSGMVMLTRTIDRDWGFYLLGLEYSGGLLYNKTVDFDWDKDLERHTYAKREWTYARDGVTSINDYSVVTSDNLGIKFITALKQEKYHHSFHLKFNMPMQYTNSAVLHDNTVEVGYDETPWYIGGTPYLDSASIPPGAWRQKNKSDVYQYLKVRNPDTTWADEAKTIVQKVNYPNKDDDVTEIIKNSDGQITGWRLLGRARSKFKTWAILTLGYGMEIFNPHVPFFWALSVPIEFDGENSIGPNGFSLQVGIKLVPF